MRFRILMAAALLAVPLAIATPALAQQSDDEAAQEMVTDPNPAHFQVYGLNPAPKSVKDESVQGGRSLPVPVTGEGQPWGIGVNVPITREVKKGDTLVMMFYARLAKAEPGVTSARIASAQIQLAGAPYTALFGKGVDITHEWQLFTVSGKADRDYDKGALNAAFHLNTGKHTVALGIVAVFDKGQ